MSKTFVCDMCGALAWDKVPLIINVDTREVVQTSDGQIITELSPQQVKVLSLIANQYPRPASRGWIIDSLYVNRDNVDEHMVDVIVSAMRKVLRTREQTTGRALNFTIDSMFKSGFKLTILDRPDEGNADATRNA